MSRRSNLTALDVIKMKELEAQGFSRMAIAKAIDRDPSVVTRHLGAVRKYTKKPETEEESTPTLP